MTDKDERLAAEPFTVTPMRQNEIHPGREGLLSKDERAAQPPPPDCPICSRHPFHKWRSEAEYGPRGVTPALASAPSGVEGLDVERLARAIQSTILTSPDQYMGPGMGAYRTAWDELAPEEQRNVIRDAEALIAEYERSEP